MKESQRKVEKVFLWPFSVGENGEPDAKDNNIVLTVA